jgi:hypothetical protein
MIHTKPDSGGGFRTAPIHGSMIEWMNVELTGKISAGRAEYLNAAERIVNTKHYITNPTFMT